MRSPGSVLVLLVQFWALQEASSLSVQQWPSSLRVTQGDRATLACQVTPARAWERLRVEWTKDRDVMCQLFVTNGSLSPRTCRPRGQPSWQAPGGLTLQLDHVTVNESGSYVCQATIEIPELEKAEGTGTQLLVDADGVEEHVTQTPRISGLLVLLAAGAVAMTSVTLGAVIWARRSCRARDSGNPLYSNVLHRPWRTPQNSETWCGGEGLGPREEHQRVYSTSLPQPVPHQALKPCPSPRPDHPIPKIRVSPGPGPSE